MARGITQDQVTKAADALLARGERPTIEKVRAELGTGSPNTLLRLIEVWWSELAGRLAAQARANLPELPEGVQRVMMTLWSEAVVTARREVEAHFEGQAQGIAEREVALQIQMKQIAAKDDASERALSDALREREAAKAEFVDQRRRAEELQQSLSAALQSLGEAQTTISALQVASEESRKAFQTDRARTETSEQRWLREVDRAREEVKAMKTESRTVRQRLAEATRHCTKLETELAALKQQSEQSRPKSEQRVARGTRKRVADPLSKLRADFDALMASMQTPEQAAGVDALFAADGKTIGLLASSHARGTHKRKRTKIRQAHDISSTRKTS